MQFNNLQSNQSNNTYNASFAPNTAADANQQQQGANSQAAPVQPLESAADLANHPAARHLQAYHSIRSGKPGAVDSLSQQETLKVLEDILREEQYKMLSVEEKNRVITAAVQFINTVRIEAKPYEKVTLFIGQTGAGKSTLINYLAGAEIKGKWSEELNAVSLDIPNMLKDISVGHGAASCTFAPMPYEDTATGLVYFDCPGFMDSRGILHEIIAAKLIQDVIRNAKHVNFVVTITESCLSDRGHMRVLKETIDVLETYAPDFEASKNSMLLVVTKGANDKNYGDPGDEADDSRYFKAKVAGKSGILNELDQELSGYQKAFLTFIHTADRFTYSFKADIKKDTPVSTVERGRIIQKIQELELVPHQEILGIKISDHAQLRSIELAEHIHVHLKTLNASVLKMASKSISDFYLKAVEELEDLFNQDTQALTTSLLAFREALGEFTKKSYFSAEAFFTELKALLNAQQVDIEAKVLKDIQSILAEIQGHESAQALFRKICPSNIDAANTALEWSQEVVHLYEVLEHLLQICTRLQDYQPIKPGLPYMEKLEDEVANSTKMEAHLKHAQEYEELGHFQDAEEIHKKALKYTESAEHYKLYAECLKAISLKFSSALPKDEAKEKAYREKASRAFYYLGELYVKQRAWEDAKNAYKASSDLALHEAALHALLDVARKLEKDVEIADALERMASFYMEKGKIALAIDKLEEAFEVVQSVTILQKLEALYGKDAAENSGLKVYETRIRLFELQISQEPKNIELYRDYGWFLKSIGRHNEARIVKKRLDKLFQTVQQKVVKQKNRIAEQALTIQDLKQKINSQAEEIDDLEEKIESLEKQKIPEQVKRLNILNEQVEFLGGQVILLDFSNRPAIQDTDLIPLLNKNPYIKSLNLQGCEHLTDAVLHILPERFANLQELNLTGCKQVKEGGLDSIAEKASKLKRLILDHCPGTTIKLLHKLNKKGIAFSMEGVSFPKKSLNCDNRRENLTDAELLQYLEANPEITDLNLYYCKKITDAGLAPLKGFQWLTSLNLQYCEITDNALEHLSDLIHLTDLNLADCPNLTSTGFIHIKNLNKLVSLYLSYCRKLTDAGFIHLKRLTHLSQLSLHNCPSLKGETLSYLRGTRWSKESTSLNFSSCEKFTDDGLAQLVHFPKLNSLSLNSCKSITENGFAHLANLKGLTSLSTQSCENLTDSALRHVSQLVQLKSLNLYGCSKLTGSGFSYFSNPTTALGSLDLSSCNVTDNNLNYLSRFHKLNLLSLSSCNGLTGSGFSYLSNLKELTSLSVSSCSNMLDDGFRHLAGLTQLASLNFDFCSKLTGLFIEYLKDTKWCKETTSLSLWSMSSFTDDSFLNLKHFKKLTSLIVYRMDHLNGSFSQHLRNIQTLTSLSLDQWNDIRDAVVQQLAQHLSNVKHVTSLSLKNCKSLTNEGLKHLATLTQLKSLYLSLYNNNKTVTGGGFVCLNALNALEKLEINYGQHLTDEDAACFKHLKNLKQLKSITFSSCSNITNNVKDYLRKELPGVTIS